MDYYNYLSMIRTLKDYLVMCPGEQDRRSRTLVIQSGPKIRASY